MKTKKIIITVCLVLVLVLCVGIVGTVTQGFKKWEIEPKEKPMIAFDLKGTHLDGIKKAEINKHVVFLTTGTLTFKTEKLTAEKENKEVKVSIDWYSSPDSEGYDINDYATVKTSDDNKEIIISLLKETLPCPIVLNILDSNYEDGMSALRYGDVYISTLNTIKRLLMFT